LLARKAHQPNPTRVHSDSCRCPRPSIFAPSPAGQFDYVIGGSWFATSDYLTLDYSHGSLPPFQLQAWRYRLQGDRLFLKQDEWQEFEMIYLSRSCRGDWFQGQGG